MSSRYSGKVTIFFIGNYQFSFQVNNEYFKFDFLFKMMFYIQVKIWGWSQASKMHAERCLLFASLHTNTAISSRVDAHSVFRLTHRLNAPTTVLRSWRRRLTGVGRPGICGSTTNWKTLLIKECAWAGDVSVIMVPEERGKILKNLNIKMKKLYFFWYKIFLRTTTISSNAVLY